MMADEEIIKRLDDVYLMRMHAFPLDLDKIPGSRSLFIRAYSYQDYLVCILRIKDRWFRMVYDGKTKPRTREIDVDRLLEGN